jgi:hypothetical protein
MTWKFVASEKIIFECVIANLWREEIRNLFQAEQDATNGGSECHCNARSACSAEYLAPLACNDG